MPAVNPKIVSCCEGSHGRLGGFTFKYAEEPAGRKGNCPSYRVGRRRALDELENVYPAIKQFDNSMVAVKATYKHLRGRHADAIGILKTEFGHNAKFHKVGQKLYPSHQKNC